MNRRWQLLFVNVILADLRVKKTRSISRLLSALTLIQLGIGVFVHYMVLRPIFCILASPVLLLLTAVYYFIATIKAKQNAIITRKEWDLLDPSLLPLLQTLSEGK